MNVDTGVCTDGQIHTKQLKKVVIGHRKVSTGWSPGAPVRSYSGSTTRKAGSSTGRANLPADLILRRFRDAHL